MNHYTKSCAYTVLIGNYEPLNEQPVAADSDLPFICLTDDRALTSSTWTVVQVEPAFPMDPIRSQRLLKLCPHRVEALRDFDVSLYVDNSVHLQAAPERLMATADLSSGLFLPGHSFRDSVHDEFIEVARLGFDDQNRIFEQLHHYLVSDPASVAEVPYWTAILLRDHRNPKVRAAMELWTAHMLRYSRRDQLSLNTVLRAVGLKPDVWEVDNHTSWFHTWPHAEGRQRFAGMRNPGASMAPLPTQLLQARGERDTANEALAGAQQALGLAQREAEGVNERLRLCLKRLEDATSEFVELQQQQAGLVAQHAELETRYARIEAQRQELATGHSDLELRHADLSRQMLDASEAAAQTLSASLALARQAHEHALQRALSDQRRAEATMAAILASRSWRITAPLRGLGRLMS